MRHTGAASVDLQNEDGVRLLVGLPSRETSRSFREKAEKGVLLRRTRFQSMHVRYLIRNLRQPGQIPQDLVCTEDALSFLTVIFEVCLQCA